MYIEEDGSPELRSDDIEVLIAFDIWRGSNPCPHDDLCLVHYRLGNMSGISRIRWIVQQLSAEPEAAFPLLWTRVIYSGTHAGDFLIPEEAAQLGAELERLEAFNVKDRAAEHEGFLRRFIGMMKELIEASYLVDKPISF